MIIGGAGSRIAVVEGITGRHHRQLTTIFTHRVLELLSELRTARLVRGP